MKRRLLILLLALCLASVLPGLGALAVDESRSYEFDLTVNGQHEVHAEPGDVLTVTLRLIRTDADGPYTMYGMQDEIRYDDEFLEIVEGGTLTSPGIQTSDLGLIDGDRAFYMNYLSLSGGAQWNAETLVGTFQVRVLSESSATVLRNENCSVSTQDGSDSYAVTVKDLRIVVTEDNPAAPEPENTDENASAQEVKKQDWILPAFIAVAALLAVTVVVLLLRDKKRKG